jgi:hypothetical protein
MFNNLHTLELTAQDIALIEAALHTQKKILSVQSQAGGTGAHQKLSDLKQLIGRVGRAGAKAARQPGRGWLQTLRALAAPQETCKPLQ